MAKRTAKTHDGDTNAEARNAPGLGTGSPSDPTRTTPVSATIPEKEFAAGSNGDVPEAGATPDAFVTAAEEQASAEDGLTPKQIADDRSKKAESLQKEYDAILEKSRNFDKETLAYQQEQANANKQYLADRRTEREKILKQKLQISAKLAAVNASTDRDTSEKDAGKTGS